MIEGWLALLVLAALGLLMLWKPRLLWRLDHFLTVKGGEPSELYLAITRITGAVFILGPAIVGLYFLFKPVLG